MTIDLTPEEVRFILSALGLLRFSPDGDDPRQQLAGMTLAVAVAEKLKSALAEVAPA